MMTMVTPMKQLNIDDRAVNKYYFIADDGFCYLESVTTHKWFGIFVGSHSFDAVLNEYARRFIVQYDEKNTNY